MRSLFCWAKRRQYECCNVTVCCQLLQAKIRLPASSVFYLSENKERILPYVTFGD